MMYKKGTQWLVITDLDGTLLNHHNYTTEGALPAIRKLCELGLPIIFNTSKTFSESVSLQKQLVIDAPFIVENGSCIYLPKSRYPELNRFEAVLSRDQYWEIIIGKPHAYIKKILKCVDTPPSYYQLLSTCSPRQASALTGLSIDQAGQAISREFSEPLIWKQGDAALTEFKEQLKEYNLNTLQGGRFLHVLGNCDKGIATEKLKQILMIMTPETQIKTIILGDSANDAAMLQVADISIIVNSPSNQRLQQLVSPDIHTKLEAPAGWAEGIDAALVSVEELTYEEMT